MFTGLIESTGTLLAKKTTKSGVTRLIIAAPELAGRWKIGDSVAVNGVCLTAVDMEEVDETHPGRFAADLAQETIERTTLTSLTPGALVNLELPTPAGSPMGGHVVQGHVDATGKLVSLRALHPDDMDSTDWRLTIELPVGLVPNVIQQGSIAVDGISLTVAKMDGRLIEIAVIPHTYRSTNLRSLLSGAAVNLEADALSKYAAKQLAAKEELEVVTVPAPALVEVPATAGGEWLTAEYLIANGY